MKIIISIILVALLSFVAGLYLPWWTIAVAAFAVTALLIDKAWIGFVVGFAGVFILWALLAWGISSANHHLLATKIGLLVIKHEQPALLILFTALSGALVAGFAGMSGSLFRRFF